MMNGDVIDCYAVNICNGGVGVGRGSAKIERRPMKEEYEFHDKPAVFFFFHRSLIQKKVRACGRLKRKRKFLSYSLIFAKVSESLNKKYSYIIIISSRVCRRKKKNKRTSSLTLIAFHPKPGNNTRSPALTDVGTIRPS